jgi:hypothetical protein
MRVDSRLLARMIISGVDLSLRAMRAKESPRATTYSFFP